MRKVIWNKLVIVFICIYPYTNYAADACGNDKSFITVVGYGKSKDEALKNSFNNAVSSKIGVLIDAKTVSKNGKLIEDKILSFSNGYIDSYRILSENEQMGLWQTKIEACIKQASLKSDLQKQNIKLDADFDGEQAHAKILTQIQSKFDAEDMITSYVHDMMSPEYIQKVLTFRVNTIQLDSDNATRQFVPAKVDYSVVFNWSEYQKNVDKFEALFEKAGANIVESGSVFPLNYYGEGYPLTTRLNNILEGTRYADPLRNGNSYHSDHLNLLVVTKKDGNLIVNKWKFPKAYGVIYPLGSRTAKNWESYSEDSEILKRVYFPVSLYQNMSVDFFDLAGNQLFEASIYDNQIEYPKYAPFTTTCGGLFLSGVCTGKNDDKIIAPPLEKYTQYQKDETVLFHQAVDVKLPIAVVKKLTKISISIGDKK